MSDPESHWEQVSSEQEPEAGLFWPMARNLGLLVAACLVVAGVLSGGGSDKPAVKGKRQSSDLSKQVSDAPAVQSRMDTGEMLIRRGASGHFLVDAEIDDVEIRFLVDTGATSVILTASDAERLGYDPDSLEYSDRFQTANGMISGAPVVLPNLSIGDIDIRDVRSSVIQAPMTTSLLGMSFLGRLEGYEVSSDGLVLRW